MYFKVHFILLISVGLMGCATQQPMGSYQAVKVPDVSLNQSIVNHASNYRYVNKADTAEYSNTPINPLPITKGNTNDEPN